MYYIKFGMKNNILKLIEYLYYVSLASLFILYLFPGSLVGYFFYGDLSQQPNLVKNPMGSSINHLFFFIYISILAVICNSEKNKMFTNLYFIFLLSIFLEFLHNFIPNRAFEYYDLFANMVGVILVFVTIKLLQWLKI